MTLPKTRNLIGWVTGAHYDYSDGEIWPEWKHHSFKMILWRLALKLGISDRKACRRRGDVWPRLATTMIGEARAHNIVDAVEMVKDIPGDLVDCGVWRGGSTILMKAALDELRDSIRVVVCCDTFDGFNRLEATAEGVDAPVALVVPLNEVLHNFEKHGVSLDLVGFLRGRVQETLKEITRPVALLRVDVDMYGPTKHCLETIYPLMPSGGVIIVDDYSCTAFKCRKAVDEFLVKYPAKLNRIDNSGVWWRKP